MDSRVAKLTKEFLELSQEAQDLTAQLNKELSYADKELVDIYHYIEFGNFNVCEGYKAYKTLQDNLRRRRNVKQGITLMQNLTTRKIDSPVPADVDFMINQYDDKDYTPRVRTDLFEDESKFCNYGKKYVWSAYKDGVLVFSCKGRSKLADWIINNPGDNLSTGTGVMMRRKLSKYANTNATFHGYKITYSKPEE